MSINDSSDIKLFQFSGFIYLPTSFLGEILSIPSVTISFLSLIFILKNGF